MHQACGTRETRRGMAGPDSTSKPGDEHVVSRTGTRQRACADKDMDMDMETHKILLTNGSTRTASSSTSRNQCNVHRHGHVNACERVTLWHKSVCGP